MYLRYCPAVNRFHREWGPCDHLLGFYWLENWSGDNFLFMADTMPLGRPWHHLKVRTWRQRERVAGAINDIGGAAADALASIFWP